MKVELKNPNFQIIVSAESRDPASTPTPYPNPRPSEILVDLQFDCSYSHRSAETEPNPTLRKPDSRRSSVFRIAYQSLFSDNISSGSPLFCLISGIVSDAAPFPLQQLHWIISADSDNNATATMPLQDEAALIRRIMEVLRVSRKGMEGNVVTIKIDKRVVLPKDEFQSMLFAMEKEKTLALLKKDVGRLTEEFIRATWELVVWRPPPVESPPGRDFFLENQVLNRLLTMASEKFKGHQEQKPLINPLNKADDGWILIENDDFHVIDEDSVAIAEAAHGENFDMILIENDDFHVIDEDSVAIAEAAHGENFDITVSATRDCHVRDDPSLPDRFFLVNMLGGGLRYFSEENKSNPVFLYDHEATMSRAFKLPYESLMSDSGQPGSVSWGLVSKMVGDIKLPFPLDKVCLQSSERVMNGEEGVLRLLLDTARVAAADSGNWIRKIIPLSLIIMKNVMLPSSHFKRLQCGGLGKEHTLLDFSVLWTADCHRRTVEGLARGSARKLRLDFDEEEKWVILMMEVAAGKLEEGSIVAQIKTGR